MNSLRSSRDRVAAVKRALLAMVVTMTACLGLAADSRAATFVETPCIFVGSVYWHQLTSVDGSNFGLTDSCPWGYVLENVAETPPNQYGGFWELRDDETPIKSVRVKLVGGSGASAGIRQGLIVCAAVCDYSKLVTLDSENVTIPQQFELTKENGLIPDDATRVAIVGDCIGPEVCPIAESIAFLDLEVTKIDMTPPVITASADHFDRPEQRINYQISARDNNSGIKSHWLTINDSLDPYYECTPQIDDEGHFGCDEYPNNEDAWLYFSALRQGTNTLTAHATNGADMTAYETFEVFLDSVAPAMPEDITITPKRNGYVSDRSSLIGWENVGEQSASPTESGIVGAYVDIDTTASGFDVPERYYAGDNISAVAVRFPIAGDWTIEISTIDADGNRSQPAMVSIAIDDTKLPPPTIGQIAPINLADLTAGRTFSWQQGGSSDSGVCGAAVAFNAAPAYNPGEDPQAPTVAGTTNSLTLNGLAIANLPLGNIYLHVRSFSCAGIPGEVAHVPVLVDLDAPTVSAFPTDGWITDDQTIELVATDSGPEAGQSGIQEIRYSIDGGAVNIAPGSTIKVPVPTGSHVLSASAVDRAGNDPMPDEFEIKVDGAAPTAVFEPTDPNDPMTVRLRTSDQHSGVAEAWIEMRPDGGSWRLLGERLTSTSPSPGLKTLAVTIPDDGEISAGRYELQGFVRDAANRITTTRLRIDGSDAGFQSPVRSVPRLSVAIAAKTTDRGSLSELAVDYGKGATLSGQLTHSDGRPIAAAGLKLTAEPVGGIGGEIAQLTTDAKGRFTTRVGAGVNRTFVVRYAGDRVLRPTMAEAQLLTRAKVRLKPSKTFLKNGKSLLIRGKVEDFGVGQPQKGKLVVVQLRSKRAWGGNRVLRTSDDGRFVYRFKARVRGSRGRPVRFQLRAVVPTEALWPFEAGKSPTTTIVVKP